MPIRNWPKGPVHHYKVKEGFPCWWVFPLKILYWMLVNLKPDYKSLLPLFGRHGSCPTAFCSYSWACGALNFSNHSPLDRVFIFLSPGELGWLGLGWNTLAPLLWLPQSSLLVRASQAESRFRLTQPLSQVPWKCWLPLSQHPCPTLLSKWCSQCSDFPSIPNPDSRWFSWSFLAVTSVAST